ncbi:MAG: choice-of-anchor J domain-containing protein [Bacteroidales bacterium]|nr:choice-of-anchor J domain-containing protein [Bacteroidales bacterium]
MVRFANVNRSMTTNNISSVLCNDYMCNMKRKSTLVDSVSAESEFSAVGRKRLSLTIIPQNKANRLRNVSSEPVYAAPLARRSQSPARRSQSPTRRRATLNSSLLTAFAVLLCLFFGGKAWGQTTVTIGSGNSTNAYLPTYSYYNYSLTQQIYTASEIGRAGTITSIAFKVSNSKSTTRSIDVYMSHTTNTNFSSNNAWVSQSTSYRVFSGSVTFSASGWTTITLATPFEYDGTSNLLLTIDDNTGSYVSSSDNSPQFYVYSASSNTAIYKYNDDTNYNPASMTTAGTRFGSKNQVQFVIETCHKPTNIEVSAITGSSATVSWTGSAGSYILRYADTDELTEVFSDDFESGLGNWTTIRNGNGTDYTDWRVVNSETLFTDNPISAHSGTNVAMSRSWNSSAYNVDNWLITPQLTLGDLLEFWVMDDGEYHEQYEVYVSTTSNSVSSFTLLASPGNATSAWQKVSVNLGAFSGRQGYIALRLKDYDKDYLFIDDFVMYSYSYTTVSPATSPYTITGLTSSTTYIVQVQSNCGSGDYSDWISETFTTTCDAITSFPYTEGFESGFPPCWTTIDNDGDGYNWNVNAGGIHSPHAGSSVVESSSNAIEVDNWLVTQAIAVPAEGEYIAEWWAASQDPGWLDTYSVYVSTGNTVSAFTATSPKLSHTPDAEYEKRSISLADYAGQTIYIAFRHNDDDKFYLKIDDFSVYAAPTGIYEIELTSVAPSSNTRVVSGENFDIEGVVTNNGARINSYVVTYTIDGGTPVVMNVTGIDLANGETHNFTIENVSLSTGQHTIKITISEPNGEDDGYVLDNSITITLNAINCGIITRLPYAEYFNNDINPCWTNRGWSHRSGFAASNSYGISEDHWLISPAIQMPANASGYIVQWTVYAYSPYNINNGNHYEVYISTTGTDPSDFTQVFTHTPVVPDANTFNQFNTYIMTTALDAYSGETIYIAFRNNVSDMYIIGIDDFKVYNACDLSINTLPYMQFFSYSLPDCWIQKSMNQANEGELGVFDDMYRFSSYSTASDYNQYLITPEIMLPDDLPTGLPLVLEFKYAASYSGGTETFRVMSYSTSGEEVDVSNLDPVGNEISTSSTDYTDYSCVIPATAKRIALNYYSNYQWRLFIDDLKISLKPEIELESVTPTDGSYVFVGEDFAIEGVVRNLSSTLSSYKVSYTVDGDSPIEYEVRGLEIPYKETHEFVHPMPISFTAGEHTIVVTISNPNGEDDFDLSNNSFTIHVTAYACTPHSDDDQSAIDASDHKVRVWTGLAGTTDWNTTGNWLQYNGTRYSVAGTLSNNTTNVFIVALDNCVTASVSNTANIADGNTATVKNLNIGTGKILSMGSGTLNVAGDFTNNGTFTAGTGTVVFNGSEAQTISSASALAFNNITFNNSNGISLGVTPTVNGTATFTSGIVSGNVTFGEGGSSAGANLNSYVDGTVTKSGNGSSFTFPTGSDGVLGTITATITSGESAVAKFNHKSSGFDQEHDGYPRWWNVADMCGAEPFNHVSNFEYWDFNTTADLSGVTFVSKASSADAHFHNPSEYPADDSDIIQIAVYDGCWKNIGGHLEMSDENKTITISGVNASRGTTRSGSAITTFGSKDPSVLLPIELTSFTATCDGRSALVEWTTATEKNNDYFSLERSDDAINFVEVARVAGAGNSIEPIDYAYNDYGIHGGDNYYRLVQVDYDGTRTVSEVIVANCIEPESDGEPEVLAYPNPFNDELTLVLDNFGNRAATIEVYDMLGKLIYTNKVAAPQNSYETILNLSNLPPAAYTVRVSTMDFVINRNVVKN